MATTQAQRASLFNTLAELMGAEDAETLMQQLPPSGWDSMATKDDLKVLGATFGTALAEFRVEVTNALAEFRVQFTDALGEAAKERAEMRVEVTNALAEAAKERAEIVKSQAKHLYITVSTIALATVSIWIALFVSPTGG